MRIVVMSDTHVFSLRELPSKLINECKKADLIIHCGDYTGKSLVNELKTIGNFKGVFGNADSIEIRIKLKEKEVFTSNGIKIGVIHGWGSPIDLDKRVKQLFMSDNVNILIYGHSHFQHNEIKDNIHFFNPGSATGSFPAIHDTYGLITIDNEINCEIVKL